MNARLRAAAPEVRVCAVVLTFNGREQIGQSVSTIRAQSRRPERILVVDNHSQDGTAEILDGISTDHDDVQVITTDENLGPAGGFHVGMKAAFEEGFTHLWLLDDDSQPDPDCLERLVARIGDRDDAIAWPKNIDENGNESWFPSWRGELLPREAVRRGGLPNKDFFWGVEDTEYFVGRLAKKYGFDSLREPSAVVRFQADNNRKAAPWHYYYRTRNTCYYRLRIQSPPRYRKLAMMVLRFWLKAVLKEDRKLQKTLYMWRGAKDGLRGRLGKTLDPADAR